MKKLLFLLSFVIIFGSANSQVLLEETFTSSSKPAAWKLEDLSGSFEEWDWEFTSGFATHIFYMSSLYTRPANAWMITKAVPLVAGETYSIQFDISVNTELGSGGVQVNGPAMLRVKTGKSQTASALTVELYDNNYVDNLAWKTITKTFIAEETTDYYFGFNCYSSGAGGMSGNAVNIRVDNVKIMQENAQTVSDLTDTKISVFPNPVNDYLFIGGLQTDSQIRIYDILGNVCIEKNLSSESETIDIKHLSNGQYFIVIDNNNKVYRDKIVIQK